jgi:hypothetical protein
LRPDDEAAVRAGKAIPGRTVEALAHELHAAIRVLRYEKAGRIPIKKNVEDAETGRTRRTTGVAWSHQPRAVLAQLRSLEKAARSGSAYRLEKHWLALSGNARRALSEGLRAARQAGRLRTFGQLEQDGTILHHRIPTPALLAEVLPFALAAHARAGRPPKLAERAALAAVLDVFVCLTRPLASDRRRRGYYASLLRAGIEFAHGVEAIFGVQLLSENPERDIKRALPLVASLRPSTPG